MALDVFGMMIGGVAGSGTDFGDGRGREDADFVAAEVAEGVVGPRRQRDFDGGRKSSQSSPLWVDPMT